MHTYCVHAVLDQAYNTHTDFFSHLYLCQKDLCRKGKCTHLSPFEEIFFFFLGDTWELDHLEGIIIYISLNFCDYFYFPSVNVITKIQLSEAII